MKTSLFRHSPYHFLGTVLTAALLTGAARADVETPEKLPAGAKVVRLTAEPAAVTLANPYEYRQLLLTADLDSGDHVDVTRLARIEAPPLVAVSSHGLVRPRADGTGALKCTLGGQSLLIPVKVSGQKAVYHASFVRDIMPAISKVGCNAGTCHGSAKGKNGFKLSLRGYDPLFDHQSLTDDLGGRRFNRAAPEQSLMLLKPSGGVPHVGGVLFHPGEPYYELFRAWIAEGVKLDLQSPRVKSIDIAPKAPVVPRIGMKQQMRVLATYTDGSVRDVTAEAFVESSNNEVAKVDKLGLVTTERRGEATMLARYEGNYTAATMIVMGDRSGFVWQPVPEYNYIDQLVDAKLKRVKILPSGLCTDAEFIRRIYLDLTGLPPQPEQVRAFLADKRPSKVKRDEMVDRLIGSPDYIDHWTNKWGDLLQVNRKFLGEPGAKALREWIHKAVAENMPYDKFVYTVLTASGSNRTNPPASYFKIQRDPGAAMENTTQLFLAVRFNCNKCHDHPFERWTQDQYYHLAAYFAQVERKEDPQSKGQKVGGTDVEAAQPLFEIIADGTTGDVKHERTGAVAGPEFPYTLTHRVPHKGSRREQLARWITSRENPHFAKSYVNRVWSYLVGVGLIEPVDDIRAGNPPTNPELLDRLTAEFLKSNFNVRELERTICKSRTYQMSIATNRWNQDDDINYSHATARRLPAEVLYDTIYRSVGATTHLPGLPAGARAAQLLDSSEDLPSGFMNLFGKPPRDSACECERSSGMMLGPVLNLVNGPIVGEALDDPANRIAKLVNGEKDDANIVNQLFLALLCRPPKPAELAAGVKAIEGSGEEHARLWAEYNKLVADLKNYEKTLPAKQAAWEQQFQKATPWTTLEVTKAVSAKGAKLNKQPDGSLLATGPNAGPEVDTITTTTKLQGITGIRLEVLPDASLPQRGPGRAPNGNFVLNEFKVAAAPAKDAKKLKRVLLHHAQADFEQPGWPVGGAIDGNPETGWAVDGQEGRRHVAIFETKEPVGLAGGTTLMFRLHQRYSGNDHNIGKLRLSVTTAKGPISLQAAPAEVAKALATPAAKRTPQQREQLANFYRTQDAEWQRLSGILAAHPKPPTDKRQLGAQDLAWALINTPEFLFNH